jgi:hypothetical protein
MTEQLKLPAGRQTPGEGLWRGGVGFLGGMVLCALALAAQAALLHAIAAPARKTG